MARITLENLQPTVEYQELSGEELESVAGGAIGLLIDLLSSGLHLFAKNHKSSHAIDVARAMAGGR